MSQSARWEQHSLALHPYHLSPSTPEELTTQNSRDLMDPMNVYNEPSEKAVRRAKLAACEERITLLETQLAEERKWRDHFLLEDKPQTSISSLPNEILTQIFENVTEEDSLAISSVLFTCNRWYRVAVSHSRPWATLFFHLPKTGIIAYLSASADYAEMALKLSGQNLLDITLDFRNMINFDGMTFEHVSNHFPVRAADIVRRGWRAKPCILAEATRNLYARLIGTLLEGGLAAPRWRSFTVKTSSTLAYDYRENICESIFSRFKMPALERVDLLDYHDRLLEHFPSMKHLLIQSEQLLFTKDEDLGKLESLYAYVDGDLGDLSDLKRLRHLAIDLDPDICLEDIQHMSLGSLEMLSIRGRYAEIVLSRVDTPALCTLRLIGEDAILAAAGLKLYAKWKGVYVHLLATESHASAVKTFCDALSLEQVDVAGVVVMPWHKDIAIEWSTSHRNKKSGSKEKTVRILEWNARHDSVDQLEKDLWRAEGKII